MATMATAQVMPGLTADASVQEDGVIFLLTGESLHLGGAGTTSTTDRAAVYVFQLPDLGTVANPFTSANLEFTLQAKSGTAPAVDLYGLGRRASATVLATDYYGETTTADPTDATRLQTSILTSSSAVGRISTSTAGNTALRDYLNAQYAGGAGVGQYVFLRLISTETITSLRRHEVSSANHSTSANRPQINYSTGEIPTASRPFIWIKESEKQRILDKIASQPWASSVYNAMIARTAAPLASHQTNRDAFLRELPINWSVSPARFRTISNSTEESEVRWPITAKYDLAIDCAVLYYLTGNESYARCAADILHNAVQLLLPITPGTDVWRAGWIFRSGLLMEARVMGNQLPIVYDFLHAYLQTNQVYDLRTAGMMNFNSINAQSVFRTYYQLTRDHGQPDSNWSALMSNCMLHNLLAFDDEAERDTALNIYLTTGTGRQHSLATDYQIFTQAGNIWPESLHYAYDVNRIRSNHLMLIDRIYPQLNVISTYIEFPNNLYRISQLRYPNGEQISFGDMSRTASKEPYNEYELAYQRAKARGFTLLANQLGARLQKAIQSGLHDRSEAPAYESLGMHNEPLQLLWRTPTIEEAPLVEELPRTDRVPFAGVSLQRNPSSFDNTNYGLMGFVGGAAHIHSHASGMSMEIYGAGRVLGAKAGTGTYSSTLHEEYYRSFASNNTVIVNGASRGQGGWSDIAINTVQSVAMEPQPFQPAVSPDFSFTASSFLDDKGTLAEATQQRTLAIVRTSPKSGFYVDVFRSQSSVTNRTAVTLNGNVTNQYHDYIYRNLGDVGISPLLDGSPMTLVSQPNRFANDIGDTYKQPGWRYFSNVQVSYPVTGSMKTTFNATISGIARRMDMHMPAVATREYSRVECPPIINAPSPYRTANAPAMVVRQIGEAWNKPFLAVYEPYFAGDGSTVQSVQTIESGGVVRGVTVTSMVDGQTMVHHVLSQPNANDTYENPSAGLSFTGRFGIAALMPDGTSRLYVGSGSSMSYRGNTVRSSTGGTQFEARFKPGQAPVIVANTAVNSTPARLPDVASFARGSDGMVAIQSSGLVGTPYRIESSTTLRVDDWTTVFEGIITASPFAVELPGQNESKKFYRIVMP